MVHVTFTACGRHLPKYLIEKTRLFAVEYDFLWLYAVLQKYVVGCGIFVTKIFFSSTSLHTPRVEGDKGDL